MLRMVEIELVLLAQNRLPFLMHFHQEPLTEKGDTMVVIGHVVF